MEYNKDVEVVNVANNDIDNLIEFKETWFIEGDLLQDLQDENHDIELVKRVDARTFTYRGLAKVGEKYFIIRKNNC